MMRLPEFFYATPPYRAFLWGRTPRHLTHLPPPAWPGDPWRGNAILGGRLLTSNGYVAPLATLFSPNRDAETAAQAELHGFAWLDDLAATGSSSAGEMARRLIAAWIDADVSWNSVAWSPSVLGRRVASWLTHATLIACGESDPPGTRVLWSIARQVRHLARVRNHGAPGTGRLLALRGLVYATACGIGSDSNINTALRSLTHEVRSQILADGGHITRSPTEQLCALAALVDIRVMLALVGRTSPPELKSSIHGLAGMLRLYRLGDGRLTVQNGATEGDRAMIDAVLTRSEALDPPPDSAPESGYERLVAGRTMIILDCGAPAAPGFDMKAHAGTLSFEISWGAERIVVNCGAIATRDPTWALAQCATAAHSTITVDDTNSSQMASNAGVCRRATIVERTRENFDGNIWVSGAHDGYQPNFGLIHRRRLYLSRDGDDLRGEDTLTGPHRGLAVARFHLHPQVDASLVQNGAAVLLRLPSGVAWRFQAAGGTLELSESIYFGGGERRRTEQITVSARLDGQGAQLRWALKRVAA